MGMSIYAAPAKINLSLRVLSKRPDGYHEVDLLMAGVNLADELEFSPAPAAELVCDDASLPVDESNLVMRAVREFEKAYGRSVRLRITLRKRIPHGAGLGGGSSDAATTLLALNEILGTGYDLSELAGMAAAIGSDVPFFLNPVPSRCTGRGEIVTPVEGLADWRSPIVIIKPSFGVSTPDAYKRLHDARRVRGLPYGVQKASGISLVNDLERPVFAKYPVIGLLKSWLLCQPGVRAAMMSGSGSAIFALTDTDDQARDIAERAREDYDPTLFTWHGTVNPAPEALRTEETSGAGSQEGDAAEEIILMGAEPEDLPDVPSAETHSAETHSAYRHTSERAAASFPSDEAELTASASPASSPSQPAAAPTAGADIVLPRKRGRKPEPIRRALAEAEDLREQCRTLQQALNERLEEAHKAGYDPKVPRRGRRPVVVQQYFDLLRQLEDVDEKLREVLSRIDQMERERS